ncbi:hypothetical protein DEFDS_P123 (plasmid) [Deferribacter desulfuricans SSM1]|uniref:Uncharacterized protein n=1 Tax=Deferribacter desulfuricans (strain DSM 14783 / JCM 11476 / NBRC 101012 / SSM1) TaxID=639282 RepID=D3PEV3_DEFDS|nr:hypothetical protein [Deferribacter desulfuricans]BAI81745.1 hypothetical protein DEFDS_P123 [Deferribacter desulfuricans SSM1]
MSNYIFYCPECGNSLKIERTPYYHNESEIYLKCEICGYKTDKKYCFGGSPEGNATKLCDAVGIKYERIGGLSLKEAINKAEEDSLPIKRARWDFSIYIEGDKFYRVNTNDEYLLDYKDVTAVDWMVLKDSDEWYKLIDWDKIDGIAVYIKDKNKVNNYISIQNKYNINFIVSYVIDQDIFIDIDGMTYPRKDYKIVPIKKDGKMVLIKLYDCKENLLTK